MARKKLSFRHIVESLNEHNLGYHFEPPTSDFRIKLAEKRRKIKFPRNVKLMLLEFNGLWIYSQKPEYAEIAYLDLYHMTKEVPMYLAACPQLGNPVPSPKQWRKVLFFYQCNGYGDLFGVCLEDFGRFKKGQVVYLDHENGKFKKWNNSFMDFVKAGPWAGR